MQKIWTNTMLILPLTILLVILGLNNSIFLFAGIFLMSGYIFFKGPEGIYGLFFMLSISPILKTSLDSLTLFNVLIFVYILKMILFNKLFRIELYQILSIALFIIYCLLNADVPQLVDLINLVSYFLIALLTMNEIKAIELRKVLIFFIAGVLVASTLGALGDFIPGLTIFLRETQIKLDGEAIKRFSGIQYNPNFYTMDLTIAIASLLYMIRVKKNGLFDWILITILFFFGMSSLSQSFLVTIICAFSIYIISGFVLNYGAVFKSVLVILAIILIGSQLYHLPYWNVYMARLGVGSGVDKSISQITTGRSTIWIEYLTLFLSNWRVFFFGVGLSIDTYHLKQSHNYYLELLVHLGIIGSLIYVNLMASIFKPFHKIMKGSWICLLPLFTLAMRGFAINLFFSESIIFYVIICVIIIKNESENYDSKENIL